MADPAVGYDGNPLDPTNGGTPPAAGGGSNTASQLGSLASLAPLIINMLKGSSQPNPGALLGTIPGGQDLLNSVTGQQQQQAPLRQAVTQQAMNMLPDGAFPGGRPALSAVGPGPAPVASSSGLDLAKLLGAGAAGGGLGAALAKLLPNGGSGGGGDLGKLLQALKNIMAGKPAGLSRPGTPLPSGNPDMNGFTGFDPFGNGSGGFYSDPFPVSPTTFGGWNEPTPNVDTSTVFNGIPGGVPNNPEDPSTIDPNWGGLLGGNGQSGGSGDSSGGTGGGAGNWWDE